MGLEHLRDQLQKLNVSHSPVRPGTMSLESALLHCLSDRTPPERQGIWSSLSRLVWTRNGLRALESAGTLGLAPGLERLDLSYNQLSDVGNGLTRLHRLTHVALSYNRLRGESIKWMLCLTPNGLSVLSVDPPNGLSPHALSTNGLSSYDLSPRALSADE